MSDVRVQIRFRNDLLQRLIDEAGVPLYKIAEDSGVRIGDLHQLKSLSVSPWVRDRETYSKGATRIAEYFNLPPEVLFPEDLYRIKWPKKLEKCFPVERIAYMLESDDQRIRALPPHELAEQEDQKLLLTEMIGCLSPREQAVIKARFGIDEERRTYEELGQKA